MAKKKSKDKKVEVTKGGVKPQAGVFIDMDSTKIKFEIPINCSYTALIPLSDLIPQQGKLKVSKGENLLKLEKSFDEHGFIEPLILWWNGKKDIKTNDMLGGHQRRTLLFQMAAKGKGTKDLLIPVIYAKSDTKEEAMKILLHLVEQTGQITQDGLLEFTKAHNFSLDEIASKFTLNSNALAKAQDKLEGDRIAKLQEEPKFPIQAHFAEKYGAVVVFYENEMDEVWLKNFMKLGKTKDYNSSHVGATTVINVQHLQKIVEDMENELRPQKNEETDEAN